jgi:hypothetical protein
MSSAVIGRRPLARLAWLENAARLEPPTRAKVFGIDLEATRRGFALVADPIHDRPRDSRNPIAELIGAN